jgi:hypothetical protein
MTVSMSWSGRRRRIFSPSLTPMRMRALCTDTSSIIESGRAKYTYSKMQGVCSAGSAACWVNSSPRAVTTIASPGATSRTRAKPRMSSATDSEATAYSSPCLPLRLPSTSGRMPCGSRNANNPQAQHHADDRVTALAAAMHPGHGIERRLRASARPARAARARTR